MRDTFIFNASWCKAIKNLSNDIKVEIYEAIVQYNLTGTTAELSPIAQVAFEFIKTDIDKADELKRKRSEAGKNGNDSRWNESQDIANYRKSSQSIANDTNTSQNQQTIANENEVSQNIANDDNHRKQSQILQENVDINKNNYTTTEEKINKKEDKESSSCCLLKKDSKGKNFVKPTIEEIQAYILEKNYHINPEKFFNYYETVGWLVGKHPMKNWHSAIATWETNERNKSGGAQPQATNKYGIPQEQYLEMTRQANAFLQS